HIVRDLGFADEVIHRPAYVLERIRHIHGCRVPGTLEQARLPEHVAGFRLCLVDSVGRNPELIAAFQHDGGAVLELNAWKHPQWGYPRSMITARTSFRITAMGRPTLREIALISQSHAEALELRDHGESQLSRG
ncbi:MAG: hypothetical protein SFV23_04180, partial [Planctomycetaceae bacterium]|nr:hypothetical protein [Planctomycetaceae bacterium]